MLSNQLVHLSAKLRYDRATCSRPPAKSLSWPCQDLYIMNVAAVERIVCEVPFTERQARITEREVYTWNVIELCKVSSFLPTPPPPLPPPTPAPA